MRETSTRHLYWVHRFLMIAASALLLLNFAVYVVYAINLMQFPFDYDQGEGFELVDTILFSQGQLPYRDTDVYPFYSSNYPPLFHVILVPFVWLFGPAYWYGRLMGFLATLIAAAAIAYAVYREGGNRWIAVLVGLAFLSSNTVYHIGPLFRQHMTMVMFETLAVIVLAGANEIADTRRRRGMLALGFGLVIAAGYTKQLAYATALAVGAFMLIRQPRRAVVWGALAALIGLGIFAWLNIATNGEWWRQTIQANINEYQPAQTVELFKLWFGLHGFLLIPAMLILLYEAYFTRFSIYSFWFIAATINSVSAGKWGAGDSYFATAIAALCILSGIFLSRWLRGDFRFAPTHPYARLIDPLRRFGTPLTAAGLVIVPLLLLGYARATLKLPTDVPVFREIAQISGITPNVRGRFYDSARSPDGLYAGGYADIGHLTTVQDIAAGYEIVALIREAEAPVMTEDAGFNIVAGEQVISNPTQLKNLDENGLFDPTEMVAAVDQQRFALIVFRGQIYPPPVLEAVGRAYTHDRVIEMNGFGYIVMRPNEEWTPPSP
jgi:hypothetical protein